MILGCEPITLNAMNNLGMWITWKTSSHELGAVVDMNGFRSWPQHSRCYEWLKVVDDMSYSRPLAQGSGSYDQLKVVDDMNDLGSLELRPLDGMNNSEVQMI